MSIQEHLERRVRPGRHVARSVLLAVRWGLITFAVVAALRMGWRVAGAGARPVRTVESVMSANQEARQ